MANFKPQVSLTTHESLSAYRCNQSKSQNKRIRFDTYRDLKKNLKKLLEDSIDNEVFVVRSRRGEWGEWFEHWGLSSDGLPIITKQGWS